jgi:hypothetical protein
MNNNSSNNITGIELTICNPFYLSLILYTIILFIILYSFDHSTNVYISNHIKFFIYSFVFLILYNLYISDFYTRKTKQDYRLSPTNESFKDLLV